MSADQLGPGASTGAANPNALPPVDHIKRTRDQYASLGYAPYAWVEEPARPPFVPLRKPLSECRLGLVSSGGVYKAGQVAFHYKDDISLRVIDTNTPAHELRATHFAYDLTDARRDPNVVLPLAALNALVAEGELGELNRNAYTFMGGIYSARKVREQIAPELARQFVRDEVDVVLLVPV